jgi:hypothetical protein
MNKKTITIVVVAVIMLCALAIIYAPNLMEIILRFHKIPQH